MPYLRGFGGFAALVLVLCAVHVIRTNRPYWWLWVIFFVPGFGAAVYFLAEVLPDLLGHHGVRQVGTHLIELITPGRSLRQLEEQVEISDTMKNRQMLARGLVAAGRYPEAIEQYERCLQGVFQDDACSLLELAYVHFLNADYARAKELLARLEAASGKFRPLERQLLLARTLEQLGDVEGALRQYESMVRTSSGEETRCRYAMLLERAGRDAKAREVYREIVARAKRSPRYYRRAQRHWIGLAKQSLVRPESRRDADE